MRSLDRSSETAREKRKKERKPGYSPSNTARLESKDAAVEGKLCLQTDDEASSGTLVATPAGRGSFCLEDRETISGTYTDWVAVRLADTRVSGCDALGLIKGEAMSDVRMRMFVE